MNLTFTLVYMYVCTYISISTPPLPQSVNARDLGATAFSDYSAGVMDIINYDVHTGNDIMQCCNYTHQILDKYCASETLVCLYS